MYPHFLLSVQNTVSGGYSIGMKSIVSLNVFKLSDIKISNICRIGD